MCPTEDDEAHECLMCENYVEEEDGSFGEMKMGRFPSIGWIHNDCILNMRKENARIAKPWLSEGERPPPPFYTFTEIKDRSPYDQWLGVWGPKEHVPDTVRYWRSLNS